MSQLTLFMFSSCKSQSTLWMTSITTMYTSVNNNAFLTGSSVRHKWDLSSGLLEDLNSISEELACPEAPNHSLNLDYSMCQFTDSVRLENYRWNKPQHRNCSKPPWHTNPWTHRARLPEWSSWGRQPSVSQWSGATPAAPPWSSHPRASPSPWWPPADEEPACSCLSSFPITKCGRWFSLQMQLATGQRKSKIEYLTKGSNWRQWQFKTPGSVCLFTDNDF